MDEPTVRIPKESRQGNVLYRTAMTSRVRVPAFVDCPVCNVGVSVNEDRGTIAKVLACGAVVIVADEGNRLWFDFSDHKKEE